MFVAGGERIHAHRCIVAACSEQLSALLQGQWAETTGSSGGVAEIKMDQSAEAVRALLRFMYTGEADEASFECVSGVGSHLQDLFDLAAQHEQVELTAACEKHCIKGLTVKTVVPLAVAAHLHELPALKAACVELIKANAFAVTMSSAFISLKTTHPLLWRELRAALGVTEQEEENPSKRARKYERRSSGEVRRGVYVV